MFGIQFTGQNIYGIIRAPRAASTEAIIVSVPFRPVNSIYLDTAPSVALILAFAKFCRSKCFLQVEQYNMSINIYFKIYII